MKAISKAEREFIRMKCRGRCSYCGIVLPRNWQADHMEPLMRQGRWGPAHPERHHLDNLWPACVLCNNDKWQFSLEQWRARLAESCDRLQRNYSTYRHAQRFGLIVQRPPVVRFFFETGRVSLYTNQ